MWKQLAARHVAISIFSKFTIMISIVTKVHVNYLYRRGTFAFFPGQFELATAQVPCCRRTIAAHPLHYTKFLPNTLRAPWSMQFQSFCYSQSLNKCHQL